MIALVLMLLAAEPSDAPTCAALPRGRSMLFEPGEIVPYRAQCIDTAEHVKRECINERNAAELADAKTFVWLPKAALAVLIGGSAAGVVTTILTIVLAVMR